MLDKLINALLVNKINFEACLGITALICILSISFPKYYFFILYGTIFVSITELRSSLHKNPDYEFFPREKAHINGL